MNLPIIYLLVFVLGACAGDNSTTTETTTETTSETPAVTTTTTTAATEDLTLMGREKYENCTKEKIIEIKGKVLKNCSGAANNLTKKVEHKKDEDKHEGTSVGSNLKIPNSEPSKPSKTKPRTY